MNVAAFNEFAAIAEHMSFAVAADSLNLSQSALSKHIKAFEQELGVRLFDRTTRQVRLTPVGIRLLPLARSVAAQLAAFGTVVRQYQGQVENRLIIAAIPLMVQYRITAVIADFARRHPETAVEITESEGADILRLLDIQMCELAFLRDFGDMPADYESLPLCQDHLIAVLPASHPLACQTAIAWADLRGEPLLLLDRKTRFYDICLAACRQADFEPTVALVSQRPENMVDYVANGQGIALLMSGQVKSLVDSRVTQRDITPPVSSTICLARRTGQKPGAAADAFWRELAESKQRDCLNQ